MMAAPLAAAELTEKRFVLHVAVEAEGSPEAETGEGTDVETDAKMQIMSAETAEGEAAAEAAAIEAFLLASMEMAARAAEMDLARAEVTEAEVVAQLMGEVIQAEAHRPDTDEVNQYESKIDESRWHVAAPASSISADYDAMVAAHPSASAQSPPLCKVQCSATQTRTSPFRDGQVCLNSVPCPAAQLLVTSTQGEWV